LTAAQCPEAIDLIRVLPHSTDCQNYQKKAKMQLSLILMIHLFLIHKQTVLPHIRYVSMADKCAPLNSFHVSWTVGIS